MAVPIFVLTAGVNQVVGGGMYPGWIYGDVSGLATSTAVHVGFDLGPNWDQYPSVVVHVLASGGSPGTFSGFTNLAGTSNDVPGANYSRRIGFAPGAGTGQWFAAGPISAANGDTSFALRPAGRYIDITVTNGDATNAAGVASKLTIVAYPV